MPLVPRFHLAIAVRDLVATPAFYVDLLGARPARRDERWIDLDLYGHQLVLHLVDAAATSPTHPPNAGSSNPVDGHDVPIPHFGVLLEVDAWQAAADRLVAAGVSFVVEPHLRFAGLPGEQRTLFVLDPSGNAVELKAFADDSAVFAV